MDKELPKRVIMGNYYVGRRLLILILKDQYWDHFIIFNNELGRKNTSLQKFAECSKLGDIVKKAKN